jgi:branched-chain amino acid transport system permease protein
MAVWVIQVLNGVSYGMLLFLLAAGLTLTFGLLRIVNLTHGSFYLLGGYIALAVVAATDNFLLGVLASVVSMGLLGMLIQRSLLSRYVGKELAQVMLTFGCLLLLGDVALWGFGGQPQTIPTPAIFQGSVRVLGGGFPMYRFVLIAAGLISGVFLWWFHDHTRLGTIVRAAVNDPEIARALGVQVPLVITAVFGLGAALAGAAGAIGGPMVGMYPGADLDTMILAIVVVVVGGLGSLRGAFLAALLVGLLDTFGRTLFPEMSQFAIFAPMALLLIVRPAGLLGRVSP